MVILVSDWSVSPHVAFKKKTRQWDSKYTKKSNFKFNFKLFLRNEQEVARLGSAYVQEYQPTTRQQLELQHL